MPHPILAVVILPNESSLIDADVAGWPAGKYVVDHLARCSDIDIRVISAADTAAPMWQAVLQSRDVNVDGVADSHRDSPLLVVDGRAWLSEALLAHLLLRVRETRHGCRVTESRDHQAGAQRAPMTLAVCLSPGSRTADAVDAADLDADAPALLIDSFAALAMVEQHVLLERARQAMSRGVRLRDPRHVFLRGNLVCGVDVEIDIGVIIEGDVALGDRVKIGAHSIVREAQIGENTRIHPFSLVEQSSIGANGFVGPYGRIRPGCAIGDGVQIGNYVEIKNAQIGAGSRINHHSFVGDAVLGDHVTLGAGTITCNHDGTRTNQTVIERGAYVGSGCSLVAPLRIGERATVGAGSTITRDVPPATLTLARARQITIEGWLGPKQR